MERDNNRNNFENHIISSYILYNISTGFLFLRTSHDHLITLFIYESFKHRPMIFQGSRKRVSSPTTCGWAGRFNVEMILRF